MGRKSVIKSSCSRSTAVVLRFGYAESRLASHLVLVNRDDVFASKLEAVQSLADWFFLKWCEDHNFDPEGVDRDACCETSRAEAERSTRPVKFCGQCGRGLYRKCNFSDEDYRQWLASLGSTTADSFGWDGLGDHGWYPWVEFDEILKCEQIIEIAESAEDVLTYALRPSELPGGIDDEIANYRQSMVEFHPLNQVSKRPQDIDDLVELAANTLR